MEDFNDTVFMIPNPNKGDTLEYCCLGFPNTWYGVSNNIKDTLHFQPLRIRITKKDGTTEILYDAMKKYSVLKKLKTDMSITNDKILALSENIAEDLPDFKNRIVGMIRGRIMMVARGSISDDEATLLAGKIMRENLFKSNSTADDWADVTTSITSLLREKIKVQ